jgi:hypothetical protein
MGHRGVGEHLALPRREGARVHHIGERIRTGCCDTSGM